MPVTRCMNGDLEKVVSDLERQGATNIRPVGTPGGDAFVLVYDERPTPARETRTAKATSPTKKSTPRKRA